MSIINKMSKDESVAIPFFDIINKRCRELMHKNHAKHGNSWVQRKDLDREFWKNKILEEVEEWYNANNQKDSQTEALDIINIVVMIYTLENVHRRQIPKGESVQ